MTATASDGARHHAEHREHKEAGGIRAQVLIEQGRDVALNEYKPLCRWVGASTAKVREGFGHFRPLRQAQPLFV
jgi:hypothetical protein